MKKEVFLAIAIGFALGLVITFGIWTANKSLKEAQLAKPTSTPEPTSSTPISPTPISQPTTQNVPISISFPEDELLTNKDSATVSGKTSANSTVAIISETGEQIITADASGNFTADVSLESGYNLVTITAFDSSGNSATQTLTVTYTTAKV